MGNGYKYILSTGSSRCRETRLFARCHIHLRPGKAVGCLPRWWIACGIPSLTSNCRRVRVRARREKGRMVAAAASTCHGVTPTLVERMRKVRETRTGLGKKKKLWPCFSCRLHSRVISHAGNECRKYKVSWVKRGCFLFPPPFSILFPSVRADYSTLFIIVYRRIRARKVKSISSG